MTEDITDGTGETDRTIESLCGGKHGSCSELVAGGVTEAAARSGEQAIVRSYTPECASEALQEYLPRAVDEGRSDFQTILQQVQAAPLPAENPIRAVTIWFCSPEHREAFAADPPRGIIEVVAEVPAGEYLTHAEAFDHE